MTKELEVKVLNINVCEIEKKLNDLNAKQIKKEYQVNTIFDTEDRFIKNGHKGYLRIRENTDLETDKKDIILTLKKNISSNGVRENTEIETKIDNKEAMIQIFSHLDLDIKHKGTKKRISYIYEDILFEIDTWNKETYPEAYLEIEVKNKKDLSKAIKLLGLKEENVTSKSLAQLRMEKGLSDL
ncbi:MAG: class IV adenylate cyclase [Firmicutes bacterium]|nr:class IV adenylate cyclase [Bacillota bacterium]